MYVMVIPAALFFLISIFMVVIGAVVQQYEILIIGIFYLLFSVVMVPLYGAINLLVSLIYNALAKKFGGLEVTVKETEE
jgi:hypothetical protein